MCNAFQQRHSYVLQRLCEIPDIDVIPADGTFYIFPCVQKIIQKRGYMNDLEFTEHLLSKQQVALVPGSAFGIEGCIRLSFAINQAILSEAIKRLAHFCSASLS